MPEFDCSAASLNRLWSLLEQRHASGAPAPAAVLLCTAPVFEAWIAGSDKTGVLEQAQQQSQAFWRVQRV